MKARKLFLVLTACFSLLVALTACFLTGCHADNYNWGYVALSAGYTGYDDVRRSFKKHVYAEPGVRLDEFEGSIKTIEHETSVSPELDFQTNGVVRFDYESKKAIYCGRFVQDSTPPRTSPAFAPEDITDPASLALKLKTSADPVSASLFSRFSEDGRATIAAYPESGLDENTLRAVLAKELNGILHGPVIYDENQFRGIALSPKILDGLKVHPRSPHDQALLQAGLNRFLLEDAYPHDLLSIQKLPPYHHRFVAIKY